MVVRDGRIAPQSLAVVNVAVVQVPNVSALPHRPRPGESRAAVQERFAQHAVASPLACRERFEISFVLDVQRHGRFERRPRDHEAAAAVREDHVADLALRAYVMLTRGVEGGEVGEQRAPEDVGVGFDEDVPLFVRVLPESLADHGQELPFVESPAGICRFAVGAILCVALWAAEVRWVQRRSSATLELAVESEVFVGGFEDWVDVFEGIDDGLALVSLGVVGEYQVVWVAAECCL